VKTRFQALAFKCNLCRRYTSEVGKPVLKDVLQGYNGSILAYGQTGAGKTHSLLNSGMGLDGKPDPKQAGLLPRLVAALFVHIGADLKNVYTVVGGCARLIQCSVLNSRKYTVESS
jgi:hypothetical protein